MPSPRIACLLVPDLPLQAELRAHPEWRDDPLAIASGDDGRAEVVAASAEARAAGVHRGASLAQARAACPALRVRLASPALEQTARDTLLDVALSLSPRAALAPRSAGVFAAEGCVLLDASGVEGLFHSEAGFASALAERARRQALPGVVGIASSRTVALLVARRIAHEPGATRVLAPGRERAFLDPLPLDLLDPDDRTAETLTRFGVRTVHDLLRLPRRALTRRLGPGILTLIDRARGAATEPPLPVPVTTGIEETVDLEAPVDRLEPIGFVLRGLLSRIGERLAVRALSCGSLDIGWQTEGGGRDGRHVGLAAPTRDVRVLLRLVLLALQRQPPDAPVESISVRTEGVPARTSQLDLFAPRGPDPTALDRTLSELEALCGEGRVGAPEVPDTHHPAAFAQKPFSPPASSAASAVTSAATAVTSAATAVTPAATAVTPAASAVTPAASAVHPAAGTVHPAATAAQPVASGPSRAARARTGDASGTGESIGRGECVRDTADPGGATRPGHTPALRAVRPPVRAEVRVDRGLPTFVRSAVTQGDVVVASGPWRTTGGWWAEKERFALDHFDVQVSDGLVIRLCYDWMERVWQIDGIYD